MNYDLAAVATAFVALVVALPAAGVLLVKPVNDSRLRRQRFRHFCWDDIVDGRVHFCPQMYGLAECVHATSYTGKPHVSGHTRQPRCWEEDSSLAGLFNRSWNRPPRYGRGVPDGMVVGAATVCTDARTLLAFLLCTVEDKRHPNWVPESLSFQGSHLEAVSVGGQAVAHVEGCLQSPRLSLSKVELERLLNGYPPWYRETITTRNNVTFPFPMDVNVGNPRVDRAGWIVGVGLMKLLEPLAIYVLLNEPETYPGFRKNAVMYRHAVRRCRDHVRMNVLPHFPDDVNVRAADEDLTHMVECGTGSGIPLRGQYHRTWTSSIPHLRRSDCEFVCKSFNEFARLQDAQVDRYRPILLPAMAAVVQGAYEVVQYLKDTGVELRIPPCLLPLDKKIWLQDCMTNVPISRT